MLPTTVSQQAISQRFLSFPAKLFEKVFKNLLPSLTTAWHSRNQRPMPESIQFTLAKFPRIWIVDSSTLEALFCKLKSRCGTRRLFKKTATTRSEKMFPKDN